MLRVLRMCVCVVHACRMTLSWSCVDQMQYGLDLTRDSTPPTDNKIRVYVNEDVGEFIGPESGANITLSRGDTVFIGRGDVEALVMSGKLRHLVE